MDTRTENLERILASVLNSDMIGRRARAVHALQGAARTT
jgi:hypothetical protein